MIRNINDILDIVSKTSHKNSASYTQQLSYIEFLINEFKNQNSNQNNDCFFIKNNGNLNAYDKNSKLKISDNIAYLGIEFYNNQTNQYDFQLFQDIDI